MKLANTFLTCNNTIAMQWQSRNRETGMLSQLTFWRSPTGGVMFSSDGYIPDEEFAKAYKKFISA